MNVKDIMTPDVKTVSSTDPIKKAAQIMKEVNCGSVPVVDHEQVVAMVTDRDIATRAVANGKGADTPVQDCMSRQVVTVSPDTEARHAANTMAENQIRRLPVVDGKKLVGILAIADLARKNIYVSESGHALSDISEPSQHPNAVQH